MKHAKRNLRRLGTVSGGLLVGLLASAPALAGGLVVGALMPMTGGLQAYGVTSLNGVRMAVDEANRSGGVLGGKVILKVGDTQTKSQVAIDAAKKLISIEGADVLIGALSSGNTVPVGKTVSGPGKVPQISSASTAPSITTLEDHDFLFRTTPSDAFQGVALAQVVIGKGVKKVAQIYINNDYGVGIAESFKKAFEARGGTITGEAAYEPDKASYRGELSKLSKGGAEALVVMAFPDNGGTLIIKQSLEEGLFDKFIFTDGMKAPEIIKQIGAQYLNGAYGTAPEAMGTRSQAAFKKAYEAKFGELPPKPFIDTAYDATMILMLAADKAGSSDGTRIRDALRFVANPPGVKVSVGDFAKAKALLAKGEDIDYVGAAGNEDFDAHGDVKGTFGHWEIKNGKIVTVKVFEPK